MQRSVYTLLYNKSSPLCVYGRHYSTPLPCKGPSLSVFTHTGPAMWHNLPCSITTTKSTHIFAKQTKSIYYVSIKVHPIQSKSLISAPQPRVLPLGLYSSVVGPSPARGSQLVAKALLQKHLPDNNFELVYSQLLLHCT